MMEILSRKAVDTLCPQQWAEHLSSVFLTLLKVVSYCFKLEKMLPIVAFISVKVELFSVFVSAVGITRWIVHKLDTFSMKWNYSITAELNVLMEQLKKDKQWYPVLPLEDFGLCFMILPFSSLVVFLPSLYWRYDLDLNLNLIILISNYYISTAFGYFQCHLVYKYIW